MISKQFVIGVAMVGASMVSAVDINLAFRDYSVGSTTCESDGTSSTPFLEGDKCINQKVYSCDAEEIQSFTNAECTTADGATPAFPFANCTVDGNNSYTLSCDSRPDSQLLRMTTGTGCDDQTGEVQSPSASVPVIVGECYPGLPGAGFILANVDGDVVTYKTYTQDDCSGDPATNSTIDLNSCGAAGNGFVAFAPLIPGTIIVDPTSPPPTTSTPTTLSPTSTAPTTGTPSTVGPTTTSPTPTKSPTTPTTFAPVSPTTKAPSVTTTAPAPPTSIASNTKVQSIMAAIIIVIVAILV